jgi:hypothetical protein
MMYATGKQAAIKQQTYSEYQSIMLVCQIHQALSSSRVAMVYTKQSDLRCSRAELLTQSSFYMPITSPLHVKAFRCPVSADARGLITGTTDLVLRAHRPIT